MVGLANHTILIAQGRHRARRSTTAPRRSGTRTARCPAASSSSATSPSGGSGSATKPTRLLSARQLASIVESSDDAIIRKSLDGIIQSWNAGAERLFGYTGAEAVGRHISLVIPPDRIAEEDQIIASLKAGRRVDHFETERRHRSGRRIRVSLTISPITDDAGHVVAASKIARDVTRQREAEPSGSAS